MIDDVQALRRLLPTNGTKPKVTDLRRLAKQVLRERFGIEPQAQSVERLVAALRRQLRNEAADAAFVGSSGNEKIAGPGTKISQTGGGHRVIRKPGLFGG